MSIAYRNRTRRKESPSHLQKYLTPKNIMLIGSTGIYKFFINFLNNYVKDNYNKFIKIIIN